VKRYDRKIKKRLRSSSFGARAPNGNGRLATGYSSILSACLKSPRRQIIEQRTAFDADTCRSATEVGTAQSAPFLPFVDATRIPAQAMDSGPSVPVG
jgi:hypothetical protein